MAATLVDLDGFTWAVGADQTGLNLEAFEQKAMGKQTEVPDRLGETRGVVFYDNHIEGSFSGETNAAPTGEIGDTIVLANLVALGGVSSGAILLYELTLTLGREALRKLSGTFKQFPGVTAA